MLKNVGRTDKILRIVLAGVLLSQVFFGLQTIWGWFGVPLLLTVFISFCPLYTLLGVKTIAAKDKPESEKKAA